MQLPYSQNETVHKLASSQAFSIYKSGETIRFRRRRVLLELRFFRLLIPRIWVKPIQLGRSTTLKTSPDGLFYFLSFMYFGALFTPWIPLEEGGTLGYPPYAPFLVFGFYMTALALEWKTTKNIVQNALRPD